MGSLRTPPGAKRIRVVGVDPAAAGPVGYGVVETDGRAAWPLRFGALRQARRASFPARLREVHRLIAELVEEFSPDAIAVEDVFAAPNVRTALKLAEVRGVVLLAAAQAGIEVHSYLPREVKAGVAGHGGATKQQMQRMVGALLGLEQPPEPEDAADALAVALCHVYTAAARARFTAAIAPPAGPAPNGGPARNSSRAPRIAPLR